MHKLLTYMSDIYSGSVHVQIKSLSAMNAQMLMFSLLHEIQMF